MDKTRARRNRPQKIDDVLRFLVACFFFFQDVGDASAALDEPRFSSFKTDAFFSTAGQETSTPDAWATREFVSAMEEATEKTENSHNAER